jgi:raffinose/stachyose/melibiose transport system permease protein
MNDRGSKFELRSAAMKSGKIKITILTVLLGIVAVIDLYPLVYLIFYSLKSNEEIFYINPFGIPQNPLFSNYEIAVESFNMLNYFKNSIIVSATAIIFVMLLALPFAYATTRMKWKLKGVMSVYVTIGLFIPIQVTIIPLAILIKQLQISNTYFALIIPYTAFNLAFASMVLQTSFESIPKELEESAFMDGASVFTAFRKIILPLTKPAVATAVTFIFLNVWNEYTVASVFISNEKVKTLPIGLAAFTGQHSTEWGPMGACLVLASIPTIVIYLIFSEQIERGMTVGGAVKG